MPRTKKEKLVGPNDSLNIDKKWKKLLADSFYDTHSALNEEELKTRLTENTNAICYLEKQLQEDEQVTALKEQLKEMVAQYKDSMKEFQAKNEGIISILRDRGVLDAGGNDTLDEEKQ